MLREHPRLTDQPKLNWPACSAIHDPMQAPWSQVRPMLSAIEAGARKAAKDREDRSQEEEP